MVILQLDGLDGLEDNATVQVPTTLQRFEKHQREIIAQAGARHPRRA